MNTFNLIAKNADPSLNATERALLAALHTLVHPTKHVAFPTQYYLAHYLGVTTRYIRKCLKHLRELGYLRQAWRNKHFVVGWAVSLTRKWADCVPPVLAMRPFIKAIKDAVKRTAKPIDSGGYAELLFPLSTPSKGESLDGGDKNSPPKLETGVGLSPTPSLKAISLKLADQTENVMQKLDIKTPFQESDADYLTDSEQDRLTDQEILAHLEKREKLLRMKIEDYITRFESPIPHALRASWESDCEKGIEAIRKAIANGRRL